MEKDFNTYMPPFMDFGMATPNSTSVDMNELYKDPVLNPMMQYEQAYCYYRYLCMQMEYKLKCKEYEKMCMIPNERKDRKIE